MGRPVLRSSKQRRNQTVAPHPSTMKVTLFLTVIAACVLSLQAATTPVPECSAEVAADCCPFPTVPPTDPTAPTDSPTDKPNDSPTDSPTDKPTDSPTDKPTDSPTGPSPSTTPRDCSAVWDTCTCPVDGGVGTASISMLAILLTSILAFIL